MKTVLFTILLMLHYPGKRQVLLFYNSNGLSVKDKQLTLLNEDKKGIEERDIIIRTYKTAEATATSWKVSPDAAFTFILVGKDGGEKLRTDTVVSLSQLYKTIDAMPMRKDEMQQRK